MPSSNHPFPPYWEEPMDDDEEEEADSFGYVVTVQPSPDPIGLNRYR